MKSFLDQIDQNILKETVKTRKFKAEEIIKHYEHHPILSIPIEENEVIPNEIFNKQYEIGQTVETAKQEVRIYTQILDDIYMDEISKKLYDEHRNLKHNCNHEKCCKDKS